MKRKWLWVAGIGIISALGVVVAFQRMLEAPFYHVGDARKRLPFAGCRAEGDRWIVLGGTQGGGVKVYERVEGGCSLSEVAALPEVEAPTAFLWLRSV